MLPSGLLRAKQSRTFVIGSVGNGQFAVMRAVDGSVLSHGSLTDIAGRLALLVRSGGCVILRMPASSIFVRTISVPEAAMTQIDSILSIDLENSTPFSRDDINHGFQVTRGDMPGTRDVRHIIIKKALLQPYLNEFSGLGIPLHAVDAVGCEGINLLPRDPSIRRFVASRWKSFAMLASVLVFVAGLHIRNYREIAVLNAQYKDLSADTQEVRNAASEAREAAAVSDALSKRLSARPMAIELLSEVTALLPDDVYLTGAKIDGPEFSVSGNAASASSVIGLFERAPFAKSVSISAPITSLPSGAGEHFELRIEVAPASAQGPSSSAETPD